MLLLKQLFLLSINQDCVQCESITCYSTNLKWRLQYSLQKDWKLAFHPSKALVAGNTVQDEKQENKINQMQDLNKWQKQNKTQPKLTWISLSWTSQCVWLQLFLIDIFSKSSSKLIILSDLCWWFPWKTILWSVWTIASAGSGWEDPTREGGAVWNKRCWQSKSKDLFS